MKKQSARKTKYYAFQNRIKSIYSKHQINIRWQRILVLVISIFLSIMTFIHFFYLRDITLKDFLLNNNIHIINNENQIYKWSHRLYKLGLLIEFIVPNLLVGLFIYYTTVIRPNIKKNKALALSTFKMAASKIPDSLKGKELDKWPCGIINIIYGILNILNNFMEIQMCPTNLDNMRDTIKKNYDINLEINEMEEILNNVSFSYPSIEISYNRISKDLEYLNIVLELFMENAYGLNDINIVDLTKDLYRLTSEFQKYISDENLKKDILKLSNNGNNNYAFLLDYLYESYTYFRILFEWADYYKLLDQTKLNEFRKEQTQIRIKLETIKYNIKNKK